MRILFPLFTLFIATACNNARDGRRPEPAADAVFYEVQISAEEGDSLVSVTFQCHSYGGDGPGLRLKDSASVQLDGAPMVGDSSAYNGTVYESVQAASAFAGPHTVSFTDDKGQTHKEDFRFEPFGLAEELPEQLKKAPFSIRLKNFPAESKTVRLVLTDTSFRSRDVNEQVPVKNGEVFVGESQLAKLVSGPVSLQIEHEQEQALKQTTKEGGRIGMRYSVRREIALVE